MTIYENNMDIPVSIDSSQQPQSEKNIPRCPTCGSTDISKISWTERTMSIIGLGILSKKIGKSFKCNHCKYTW